ncbi:MAG: histidine phosphatase family protein [Janthinobacterium lividum]
MAQPPGPVPAIDARPFWFLRHGETDWNANGLSQGRTDVPLNARGLAQAREAAAVLAAQTAQRVTAVVSSPLVRARVTAEIAAAALGLPVAFDPDLQEVSFGEQEGLPMGDWYDSWIAGDYTPAGAEPFAALRARIVPAVNRALAQPGPVLVVAHGALFRAVRSAMGLAVNVRTPNGLPMWCEPSDTGWTLTAVS